jgi:tetratricopeptide (TPR) repeat protein
LKSFRSFRSKPWLAFGAVSLAILAAGALVTARGSLPTWIRNIEARTELEAAFFRPMALPHAEALFRRPPSETRAALGELVKKAPKGAELYSLRAMEDEQQLDFAAAEADWKSYAENAADKGAAQLALADFYHRRVRPQDEIKTLAAVGSAPAENFEKLTPPPEQRSWLAYERVFSVIHAQGLPKEVSIAQFRGWLARYPKEQSLYARYLQFLISAKEFGAANQLVEDYRKQFPNDASFPIKAQALVQYEQGSLQQGLAVYEKRFQPLWEPELVKSYFDLLAQTHSLRKFLDDARAAVNAHPEDLTATVRVFYYYQQQGKLDAAQEAITRFRLHKDSAKSAWSPQELLICAKLLEDVHVYPESARYYFALYNSKGSNDPQERALAGLARLLLRAPEMPIRFGTGELSMYRDIATMDQGPGYLNGILSLILNTTNPASEFSTEEQRAVSYFHRSRAAELLALLDAKYPNSLERAELHAQLLDFYSTSGESEAVIKGGKEFLAAFPNAAQRTTIALLMADAYARTGKYQEEFSIYDAVLEELATKATNVPLGNSTANYEQFSMPVEVSPIPQAESEESSGEAEGDAAEQAPVQRQPRRPSSRAFQVNATAAATQLGARSPEYARVLERYLARLVQLKQIPQALAVLRREIDHNADDPGLYERLAVFLEQNRLGTEQEEIYRRAMARFPDRSWYHKLARFYLRRQKNVEFEKLTQEAINTFKGSELEGYFQSLVNDPAGMYLRLNQYANARFPHNPVFVRNLLSAYRRTETWDPAAWEALLRQHWFEEADLRNVFFQFLSSNGKLEAELKAVQQGDSAAGSTHWNEFVTRNPGAGQFVAQAAVWRSHFEESAPVLKALADAYPAEVEIGRTASSVFRSMAYFDGARTSVAVKIEDNLLSASPGSTENLARIGDIYADRELFAKAAPYWERIPLVAPGESGGYLEAATIYWDYYDFDNALRLLGEGRKKLADDNLYCYELGAIYEGKRDYAHAIQEYVRGAVSAGGGSPSENRLLQLAGRPKYRDLVDSETQKLARVGSPSMAVVSLRMRVLETQNRKAELGPFLDGILNNATTIEQAADIESLAAQKSLELVRQHALEKQAALASDPVTRLQLRYALVRLYESRKDLASAQRNIETLYRDNPKILGVVRSTVDFYWRRKLYAQAMAVLQQAAKDAYPELGKQFLFEAARKSTETRQFEQARGWLGNLLLDSPYDSQYLAAMADTYAQAGDQQGLKKFYLDKIGMFRSAPLSNDARKAQIATLRRGLIPALTRLEDFAGGVDQYIELINNFPEDEGLVAEAALFGLGHKRQQQLLDFYSKTIQQSTRDYRWSMVLARIQTSLEDFPAAIDTYGKSIAIRPDRTDLRIARAELDERLMRFDDAAADYEQLYQLAYKDPKWMERVAEVRARQGKSNETVAALKAALIEGRPEKPDKYFEVARRLESWGMLLPAQTFAEQGIAAAGAELLAENENHAGVNVYARIMTRLRQPEKSYGTLQTALSAAASALPVLQQQVGKQGIAAVTNSEWRQRVHQTRIENARVGMQGALAEMGSTVARYFTPAEKLAFAQSAQKWRSAMSFADVEAFAVLLAQNAGLAELEATWRYQLMMEPREQPGILFARMNAFVNFQRRRLKFEELGQELEGFAPRVPGNQQYPVQLVAAQAYRSAGDSENELRVLSKVNIIYLSGEIQKHYFDLLLARRPQELVQLSSNWTPWGEQAADYAVANGDPALVHAVVSARGRTRPPVWPKTYSALVGLYFAEPAPGVNGDFLGALGDNTIGERLGKPIDRKAQLAGDIWYYYGARYGEYLSATKQEGSEDFLTAALEQSPASSDGYLALADYYAENGDLRDAIGDYNHTLELTPGRADVHDRLAVAYFKQGARAEALMQWKLVFAALNKEASSARVPENFWTDFARACNHVRTEKLFAELKPDVDALLRAYLRRNGNYRSNPPLRSAFLAAGDPAAATAWLIDLASVAPNPTAVLLDIVDAPWIPLAQRAPIYQQIMEAKKNAFEKAEGIEKENAGEDLRSLQVRWVSYLIQTKQFVPAEDYLSSLAAGTQRANEAAFVPLELQVAAQRGSLDAKIAAYRSNPAEAPGAEVLRNSARQILEAGDKPSARKILEFVFAREIDEHKLVAANFLGLADIRVADGDLPGALELLRRLVLVVGNPFENLDPAAALLERTGHPGEAVEFLEQLVKSTPWEPGCRLRLAKAKIAVGKEADASQQALVQLASSTELPYRLRIQAAEALTAPPPGVDLGSHELKLAAGIAKATPLAAADQPFFYEARIKAAEDATDPKVKLQLLGKALGDTPARDDARIPLFLAATSLHEDEFALASIEQLLREPMIRRAQAVVNREEEESAASGEEAASREQAGVISSVLAKLSLERRVQVLWSAGEAMIWLARLNDSLPYLLTAQKLEKDAARQKQMNARISEIKGRIRREQLNSARQPILHEPLEQDRLVHPRLVANTTTAPASGKGGERP